VQQASKQARKLLNDALEQLDQQIFKEIKKVRGYQDKRARREDLLNQLDVVERVRKELNKLMVETTDDTE
jgi:vacuolar-type H+-ATPase subunit H